MNRQEQTWDACPEGEIAGLAEVLHRSHHKHTAGILIGIVAGIVFVATVIGVVTTVF